MKDKPLKQLISTLKTQYVNKSLIYDNMKVDLDAPEEELTKASTNDIMRKAYLQGQLTTLQAVIESLMELNNKQDKPPVLIMR